MHKISAKLLIISDDPGLRSAMANCLEDEGYNALDCEGGLESLRLLERVHPDLVISDLGRDVACGKGQMSELLQHAGDVPVVAVSAVAVASDALEVLRLGAADYLIRPLDDPGMLEHAIRRVLEQSRLQHENRLYRERLEATNIELQTSLNLLQEDLTAGRQVQRKMLPEASWEAEGFRFEHSIIPSLYLSGDFVDYFRIDHRRIGFYLADVSGHGASSAFVTVLLKFMTTRLLYESRRHGRMPEFLPSEVLSYINRGLINCNIGKHLTMLGGVIDQQANTLTYSVGGHLPLPVMYHDGEARYLQGKGMAVGLLEPVVFHDHRIELPQDFRLNLFSDGILELLPVSSLREKESLLLRLVAEAGGTLEGLSRIFGLAKLVDMPDDIAMLVLSRSGQ